jgi:hypothetical protein
VYSATVQNTFPGRIRTFGGSDRGHVTGSASSQLQKWAEQESRPKTAAAKQDAIELGEAEAASMDDDAKEALQAVSNLLRATLAVHDRSDWNELRDLRVPGPFSFAEPIPQAPEVKQSIPRLPSGLPPAHSAEARHPSLPRVASCCQAELRLADNRTVP